MAPHIASRCRPNNPLRCAWRSQVAQREPGRIHYSHEARAWLLWLGDLPTAIDRCPGCGGTLPLMGRVQDVETWLRDTLGDPEE